MKKEFKGNLRNVEDPFSDDGQKAAAWVRMNLGMISKRIPKKLYHDLSDRILMRIIEYRDSLN